MAHRADQILEAVAALVEAATRGPKGWKSFTHRRESLDGDQDELPAYSSDVGPLTLLGYLTGGIIRARLTVHLLSIARAPTESEARQLAVDMQRQAQIALMATADQKLGLDTFVDLVTFGGWPDGLQSSVEGEWPVAALSADWFVDFRMNVADPGDA